MQECNMHVDMTAQVEACLPFTVLTRVLSALAASTGWVWMLVLLLGRGLGG